MWRTLALISKSGAKVLLFFDIHKKKGWFCHYFANFICTYVIFLVTLHAKLKKDVL